MAVVPIAGTTAYLFGLFKGFPWSRGLPEFFTGRLNQILLEVLEREFHLKSFPY